MPNIGVYVFKLRSADIDVLLWIVKRGEHGLRDDTIQENLRDSGMLSERLFGFLALLSQLLLDLLVITHVNTSLFEYFEAIIH